MGKMGLTKNGLYIMLLAFNNHSHGGRGMILASAPTLGKSNRLVTLAQELGQFVAKAVEGAASFDHLERGIWAQVLQMGRAAVDLFLDAQGTGDLDETVSIAGGPTLYRSPSVQVRELRSIFGEHSFQSYVYAQGPHEKIELRPIDARLQLPKGKASYLLQEFSQLFCIDKAFGVGAEQFALVFQQQLAVDTLERINRTMGTQAEEFLEQLPMPPAKDEAQILVVTADGKGVPLVRADAQQVPAFEDKERPGNRRMATLGCVYSVDPYVRTPQQIVAALFRDRTVPQPEEQRPEPCAKHYRGCFAEPALAGQTAVPGAYGTFAWIVEEVKQRHQPGQTIVRLLDGQASLLETATICMAEFLEELQAKPKQVKLVDILDILHVSGYVWRAAKVFQGTKEHQEAFVEERLLRLLEGDVRGVVTGLRRMASARGLTGKALKEVTTVCNYFEKNAQRMRYDEYLAAGYPIATGVIEGACRHVIKDRMERGGMRWTLPAAKSMLNVRAVSASSQWTSFHSWRQAEEAKRLHPHRALVIKSLSFAA
jgi:hypothetical protein